MKKVLNIVGFLAILCASYIAITNVDVMLNLRLWGVQESTQLELQNSISLPLYTLIIFILGIIAGTFSIGQIYCSNNDKLKAYKRELEKTSIEKTSSSTRVDVLEAKIATLEKALNDALSK